MSDTSEIDRRGQKRVAQRRRVFDEIRAYAAALLIAFLIVTFLFNTVGVVGASMLPTLHGRSGTLSAALLRGDRIFIPKYETWLRRIGVVGPYQPGDIVIVREPENSPTAQLPERQECLQESIGIPCRPFLVKRVVAGPGDELKLESGRLYLNGGIVDNGRLTESEEVTVEPQNFPMITQAYGRIIGLSVDFGQSPTGIVFPRLPTVEVELPVYPADHPLVQYFFGEVLDNLAPIPSDSPADEPFVHPFVVPEGHYFVMGDNRSPGGSEDSRAFGFVEGIDIAGRATHLIWPPRRNAEWNWGPLEIPSTFAQLP